MFGGGVITGIRDVMLRYSILRSLTNCKERSLLVSRLARREITQSKNMSEELADLTPVSSDVAETDVNIAANPPDSSADVVVRNTSGIAPVFA